MVGFLGNQNSTTMLRSSNTNLNLRLKQKPIKVIKKDDKPLTRDHVSMINFSMDQEEYYHGAWSVAIPFNWESQPGTPKVKHKNPTLPPLTPPPSYFYATSKRQQHQATKKPKPNFLDTVFPKRVARKTGNIPTSPVSSSPSPSLSSSSSRATSPWSKSYSVPSSPAAFKAPVNSRDRGNNDIDAPRLSIESRRMIDDECESPLTPSFCFGFGRGVNVRSRGRHLIWALLRDV